MANVGRIRGGKKLDDFIRRAELAKGVREVEAGFYATATYPDGTPVTNVALWQEFGTETAGGDEHIPERPFQRNAIPKMADPVLEVLIENVDPMTMVVDRRTAGLAGEAMVAEIQRSIVDLREPPNAPSTLARPSGPRAIRSWTLVSSMARPRPAWSASTLALVNQQHVDCYAAILPAAAAAAAAAARRTVARPSVSATLPCRRRHHHCFRHCQRRW